MRKLDQKGFTAVEGLLIFVIISILAGTGWYVWHANRNIKVPVPNSLTYPSSTKTTTKQSTPVVEKKEGPSIQKITYVTTGTPEQKQISKRLFDFYTAWNQLTSSAKQFSATATPTKNTYLTKAAQKQEIDNSSYDLFTCSQEKLELLAIGRPTITGNNASVQVTTTDTAGNVQKPITLSLLKQDSNWYIDHAGCPF